MTTTPKKEIIYIRNIGMSRLVFFLRGFWLIKIKINSLHKILRKIRRHRIEPARSWGRRLRSKVQPSESDRLHYRALIWRLLVVTFRCHLLLPRSTNRCCVFSGLLRSLLFNQMIRETWWWVNKSSHHFSFFFVSFLLIHHHLSIHQLS